MTQSINEATEYSHLYFDFIKQQYDEYYKYFQEVIIYGYIPNIIAQDIDYILELKNNYNNLDKKSKDDYLDDLTFETFEKLDKLENCYL
jgi:ABC-type enterochelin transport system ATPase subunit